MFGTETRKCRRALTLVMLLSTAACYEHTYNTGAGAPNAPVVYQSWHNHRLGGLISPNQKIAIAEMCPSGNATIHEEVSFLNGLVGALAGEIYATTTVEVRCDTRSADLDFSAADVERIVTSPGFFAWVVARARAASSRRSVVRPMADTTATTRCPPSRPPERLHALPRGSHRASKARRTRT